MTEHKHTPSSVTSSKAGEGTDTRTAASGLEAGGTASGNNPVAPPSDAKPGAVQGGSISGGEDTAPAVKEGAGYALKVTAKNHTHAGVLVKHGKTIMLDVAEYRWALQNKVGVPGNADDAQYDVDSKGEVVSPATELTLAELETKAKAKG